MLFPCSPAIFVFRGAVMRKNQRNSRSSWSSYGLWVDVAKTDGCHSTNFDNNDMYYMYIYIQGCRFNHKARFGAQSVPQIVYWGLTQRTESLRLGDLIKVQLDVVMFICGIFKCNINGMHSHRRAKFCVFSFMDENHIVGIKKDKIKPYLETWAWIISYHYPVSHSDWQRFWAQTGAVGQCHVPCLNGHGMGQARFGAQQGGEVHVWCVYRRSVELQLL